MRLIEKFKITKRNRDCEKVKRYLTAQNLELISFVEGFGRVKRGRHRYNFIKPSGTLLSKEWFYFCDDFVEGFGVVCGDNGNWNYIKPDGTILSNEWFDWCDSFSEGFGRVMRKNGEIYIINKKGKLKKYKSNNFRLKLKEKIRKIINWIKR